MLAAMPALRLAARSTAAAALVVALALAPGCRAKTFTTADRDAIVALLAGQQNAWNDGDIDRFMVGYAHAETLTFASGGQVQHGWDATIERYRRRYPDAAAMGVLAFDLHEIRPLSADVALVIGAFTLTETPRGGSGVFSLIVQRRPEGWRIVHDHTSAAT